jgi:hypothetical protein
MDIKRTAKIIHLVTDCQQNQEWITQKETPEETICPRINKEPASIVMQALF